MLLATLFSAASSASAAVLFGTVTEIADGNTVTILCLKRPLNIGLEAVDAPEKDQPYGDVAKQHLSDLIAGKYVSVEYTGLGSNALIIGKITCDEMDVGAQMLRDGVAWYDKNNNTRLTEDERKIYAASEAAARKEHRGLWQDSSPTPPWEFRLAAESRAHTTSQLPLPVPQSFFNVDSRPSFNSDDLILPSPDVWVRIESYVSWVF